MILYDSNEFLREEPKVKIYKTIVQPILIYATETIPDTVNTRLVLETTGVKRLKKTETEKETSVSLRKKPYP